MSKIGGGFSNFGVEHDNFGCHGGHFVGKTVGVDSIHISLKGIPREENKIVLNFLKADIWWDLLSIAHSLA